MNSTVSPQRGFLARALEGVLDPGRRPGLEATEHFMSWLRFGLSATATAVYLLSLPNLQPVGSRWETFIGVAFLYSIPNILLVPGRPTRWTRLRILFNTVLDFILATAAVLMTGGVSSAFTWLYALIIVGNVLRYGDVAGAATVGGSMVVFGATALIPSAGIAVAPGVLLSRLGALWLIYLMIAYLSRYATRMERVARKGTQIMEAIGRIGVPVNLAGNVSLALEAVCDEIRILFDVDQVYIWLVESHELAGVATTSGEKEDFLALRRPLDDPSLFSARIVRERRPLYINAVRVDHDGADLRLARSHGMLAVAGIPLSHGPATVGAMILGDARNAHRFREEDMAPAMLLGNLAATALYHASMHDQLRAAYTRTLETLGEAVDVRDAYTGGHSHRIAKHAARTATAVGCSPEQVEHIRIAATLHDIGKIGIPDSILLKPDQLTEREMEIMKSHSLIGARLLRLAGFPDDVVAIVRHLHERYDGSGYPGKVIGEAIPLGSRILAVADTFEAMTSDRVYRPALRVEDALEELGKFAGTQFDPVIVEAFVKMQASASRPTPAPKDEQDAAIDLAHVYASVVRHILEGFGEFAGPAVVSAVVRRVVTEARRQGWTVTAHDSQIDVETQTRHTQPEARRQVLMSLIRATEELGGQRIADHLVSEAVEGLSPAAREIYWGLLAPPGAHAAAEMVAPAPTF